MAEIVIVNRPVDGLDMDSGDHAVADTDARDALNLRNSYTYIRQRKTGTGVKGNVLVTYNLGPGTHRCLGTCSDDQFTSIVYFVWASTGNHQILRYFPNKIDQNNPNGIIINITTFNFQWDSNEKITATNIVTGKQGSMQYWIDHTGLHKINLDKGALYNKFKTWTCYMPKNFNRFQSRFFFVINPIGSTTPIRTLTIDTTAQPQITTIGLLWEYLANAINADSVARLYIKAEACDCKMELSEVKVNTVNVFFLDADIKTVPDNWYGLNLIARYFVREKWPPVLSPVVQYGVNPDVRYNSIKNRVWQFRLQYFYDDYEESTLGPDSQIAINETINNGLQIDTYNYININFNDADIDDVLVLLKRIAVLARIGNVDDFRQSVILDICDFLSFDYGLNRWYCDYNFYNNTQATAITKTLNDNEFSLVPIHATDEKYVDERMVTGGPTENYDPVDCIDITVKQEFEDGDDDYVTLSGQVWIYNRDCYTLNGGGKFLGCIYKYTPDDPDNPKIYEKYPQYGGIAASSSGTLSSTKDHYQEQLVPLSGILVYAAGDPYYAITDQEQLKLVNGSYISVAQVPTLSKGVFDGNAITQLISFLTESGSTVQTAVRHTFSMKVKKGRRIIRIASPWCSFGDVLEKGPMYDMYNGLEYQSTSAPVLAVNKIDQATGNFTGENPNLYEIEVDVQADTFIGEFIVEDLRSINKDNPFSSSFGGYVVDGGIGGVSAAALRGAPTMEYQQVCVALGGEVPVGDDGRVSTFAVVKLSDHNGYFYFNTRGPHSQIADGTLFDFKIYVTGWVPLPAINPYLFNGDTVAIYGGQSNSILKERANENMALARFDVNVSTGGGSQNVYYIYGSDYLHYELLLYPFSTGGVRTSIQGEFLNSLGVPLGNSIVQYTRTGRKVLTDLAGKYSILIYASYDAAFPAVGTQLNPVFITNPSAPYRHNDDLLATYNVSSNNINNNPQQISIYDFTLYTPTNPYLATDFILAANYDPFGKSLKRGGLYQIGYREYDAENRCNTVMTNIRCQFYIPFITEDLNKYFPDQYPPGTFKFGKPRITITLNFRPSQFAKAYQLLLIENQYETNSYLQFLANEITYVSNIGYSITDSTQGDTVLTTTSTTGGITTSKAVTTLPTNYNPPVVSSYSSGDATNIYISIKNLIDYKLANPSSVLTYEYKAGDRIRLIADASGRKYRELYEMEVTGFDIVAQSIIVKNAFLVPELKAGVLFEVFSPRLTNAQNKLIFYEVGEAFLCTNPGQPNNNFSVNPILLKCGDTYWRGRDFIVNDTNNSIIFSTTYVIEDAGLSDFYDSKYWDIGRIGIADPNFKQQFYPMGLRVSDNFIADTTLNGLSTYLALNNKDDLSRAYGQITKLEISGQVLIVIATNKTITIYLGAVLARDQAGQGLLQVTQQFFGNDNPLVKDYGCQNPESVVNFNGYIYFPDFQKGVMVRYADNGLFAISEYKMQSFFKEYGQKEIWDAPAIYDKAYEEYIITIYEKKNVVLTWVNGQSFAFPPNQPDYPIEVGDVVYIEYVTPKGEVIYKAVTVLTVSSAYITFVGELSVKSLSSIVMYYKDPNGITIAFMEKKNRFTTRYSYLPESYGITHNKMVSFKNGELWAHDINPVYNNFYGTQYKTEITIIANTGEKDENIVCYEAMRINTQQDNQGFNWDVPAISNRQGQQSRISRPNFIHKEQYWYSEFKKDTTTLGVANPIINGREVRSQAIVVVLTNDYTGLFDILSVACEVLISERNVK